MTEREQQASNMLQDIANDIKSKLPEGMGFCLLAYEFGDGDDKKLLYVANSNRLDTIWAMTEFVKKNVDNPEIFGKDVN